MNILAAILKDVYDHEQDKLRNSVPGTPCQPATITERLVGGIEDLSQMHMKLDEILLRIHGPEPQNPTSDSVQEREPGLQGEVDILRNSINCLNLKADEILSRL